MVEWGWSGWNGWRDKVNENRVECSGVVSGTGWTEWRNKGNENRVECSGVVCRMSGVCGGTK